MSKPKGRRYNYIYSKLVTTENGLTGFVAYCLYKQKKVAWIKQFKQTHSNVPPTDKQIEDEFSKGTMSDPYLQGLLQEAENMREKLLNEWTQQHEDEKSILKQKIERLEELISISVKAYLSPTWMERIKRWGKDLLFTFISLLLWFGLFFLFGKIYPPFKAFLLGQLASFTATP
ncbi:hypothetical protein HMPREF1989_00526 [Porphyromonas gingivalis F0566]|uniref:hypothetical protein n=1 Tax=Porphyromonas gingivalis TaxID=837 RepID=UPI0003AD0215|nr:hypothetical protein [Porphyromonas gingivalis]ERJ87833.1 hypothetical protein HMPREF1989_00526 [Porphyromonas gingivalis F0566]